jgi:hypothetical protein
MSSLGYDEILTSPRNHDKDDFIYLVHATTSEISSIEKSIERLWGQAEYNYRCCSLLFNLDPDEDGIVDDGSHVGHTTLPMYHRGLIVEPAKHQVEVAFPMDMGSPSPRDMEWWLNNSNYVREPPQRLLEDTPDGMNNEVILNGDSNAEIKGVFYIEDFSTEDSALGIAEYLEETYDICVPTIPIPHIDEDDLEREGQSILEEKNELW